MFYLSGSKEIVGISRNYVGALNYVRHLNIMKETSLANDWQAKQQVLMKMDM